MRIWCRIAISWNEVRQVLRKKAVTKVWRWCQRSQKLNPLVKRRGRNVLKELGKNEKHTIYFFSTYLCFQQSLVFENKWTNENVEPISNKKPAFHWKLLFQLDMQNLMDPSNSAIHGLVQWPIFMLVDLASNFCINQVGNPCSYKKHTARDGVGLLELPT